MTRTLLFTFFIAVLALPVLAIAATQEDTQNQDPTGSTGTQTGTTGTHHHMGTQTGTTGGTMGTETSPSGTEGTMGGTMGSETGETMHHPRMGHMSKDEVMKVQQALKDKGNDPGPVDGIMGPKTKAAVRDFQKANGLKETGHVDSETRDKLGISSTQTM